MYELQLEIQHIFNGNKIILKIQDFFPISGHNDCQECEAKFHGKHSKKDLNHHKRTKHPEEQNKCSICDKSIHKKYLAKHIANKHSKQNPEFIKEIFGTKNKALSHIKFANGQKKQTKKHKPLIFYKKISKEEVKFVCVKCKVSFNNENEVNIHFKRVHVVKRDSIGCELVQNVNEYVQNEREYVQNEREYVQNEREHVQSEHKALQTFNKRRIKGIVKFECATCVELFDSKVEVTAHFKSVHEEKNEVHEEKKEYECPNCQETFRNRSIFKGHVAKYHDNVDLISVLNSPKKVKIQFEKDTETEIENEEGFEFECQICDKTFENEYILTNHFNTIHSDGFLNENMSAKEAYDIADALETIENKPEFQSSQIESYSKPKLIENIIPPNTFIDGLITIIPIDNSKYSLDESVNHLDCKSEELNNQEIENIELGQTDEKIQILENLEFENFMEMPQNFKTVIETKPDEPNTYVICETSLPKSSPVHEENMHEFQ